MYDNNSLYQTAAAVRLSPVCVKTESELRVKIICDGSAAADRLSPEPTPNNSASEDLGVYKQHDPISTYDQETEQIQEGNCHKCQVYSEEKEEESSNCIVAAVGLSPVSILEKDEENRSLLKPSNIQRQIKESKPKPSDKDATSAERLSLVCESKSNTTELQDVPTKSKVMEQRRFQPSPEYTFTVFLENYARSQNEGKHSQSVSESKKTVVKVSLNKFVLESDCLGCFPVLPAAETMASVKHMTLDTILAQANRNVAELYGL